MIYLDNAAGSHPKAPGVAAAMLKALNRAGANPGRGHYALARSAGELVEGVRERLARMFGIAEPQRIAFTSGATMSLNTAILGWDWQGGEAVVSSMEHNALLRPLYFLEDRGLLTVRKVQADPYGYISAEDVEAALSPRTRLIALSHASNVCGAVQPLAEIGQLAYDRGIPLLVDASQSAGLLPLDVEALHIDMLALAGHKYLLGPAGIGALWVRPGLELTPLLHGGTGLASEERSMPEVWPQHLEAGSLNVAGIAGWGAGLDFLSAQWPSADAQAELLQHLLSLTDRLAERVWDLPGVELQLKPGEQRPRTPLLSLTWQGAAAGELAEQLDRFGICVRAGYHCAPEAHRALGTFDEGSVRFSPGWATGNADIERAAAALSCIVGGREQLHP